jgi:hypothetical protein
MSRKGNCWDNAPAESFFATLKVEELRHFEFNTREEARDKVVLYICWYNAHRRRLTLGLLSPATFEAQSRTPPPALSDTLDELSVFVAPVHVLWNVFVFGPVPGGLMGR